MYRVSLISLVAIFATACTAPSEGSSTASSSSSAGATDGSAGSGGNGTSGGNGSGGATGGGSSDGSGGFVAMPDGGGKGAIECDIWAQDCPEGEKCMPWSNDGGSGWNAVKCTPLDPAPKAVGDSCTYEGTPNSGVDNCEKGAMCWDPDVETKTGVCIGLCKGSADSPSCDDPSATCTILADGILPVCLTGCDPLTQDCPMGQACVATPDGFSCVFDASGDAGQYGDPCEFNNVCDPGLVCLNNSGVSDCMAGAIGCCLPFCDLKAADPNAACSDCTGVGCECVPWFAEGTAPPGQEDVGVCTIPS